VLPLPLLDARFVKEMVALQLYACLPEWLEAYCAALAFRCLCSVVLVNDGFYYRSPLPPLLGDDHDDAKDGALEAKDDGDGHQEEEHHDDDWV